MHPIRPLDLAWLLVESQHTPMHVGAVQIFRPPDGVGVQPFLEAMLERWNATPECRPPFCYKAESHGLRTPAWTGVEALDLDLHLQNWALPRPGDNRQLMQLVSRLFAQELDMREPLWEVHVIEGLADERYALFTKIHHAVIDGVGGVNLLHRMLSNDPARRGMPPPWAGEYAARSSNHHNASPQGLAGVLKGLRTQIDALPQLREVFGRLLEASRQREDHPLVAPYRAPDCILNRRIAPDRTVVSLQLPLSDIREIAHRHGATVNDAFLTVCAGGLRRYLETRNALPDEPLTAGLPVSIRPEGDTTIGTAVTFILANLATDIADPEARLERIHRSTSYAKKTLEGMSRTAIIEYTLLLMAPYMLELVSGLAGRAPPVFNVVVSNVPGPREPLYYDGARLESMYPMSIITHGQAVNITVLSYDGWLNVGITGCRSTLPELEQLVSFMQEEYQTLAVACGLSPAE